jgi:hypothetical protein
VSAVVRTNSTSVDDPLVAQFPAFMGYCGVHSAECGPVWSGDLGRSETAASTARRPAAPGPATHLVSGCKSGLHVPLGVLT